MQYEIRKLENGIMQITTADERWYRIGNKFMPSSSWVSSYYPKGKEFMKWLAAKGWDDAELIKNARGAEGSIIHLAVELLRKGEEIKIDSKLPDNNGGIRELTADEYYSVMTYVQFYNDFKIKPLATEFGCINEEYNYAGRGDHLDEIEGEVVLIDLKTSQHVYPSHEIQLSSYLHSESLPFKPVKQAILQIGYKLNKKGYKLTFITDKFHLFLAARTIWENECSRVNPLQRDFPLSLSLN